MDNDTIDNVLNDLEKGAISRQEAGKRLRNDRLDFFLTKLLNFCKIVAKVRAKQMEYFSQRTNAAKNESIKLESDLDKRIHTFVSLLEQRTQQRNPNG